MPPPPVAPWKKSLVSQIQSLACPTFSLATLSTSSAGVSTPHVRTLIYRGFYADLPMNKHNPVKGNAGWTSNLITFTTDKRMAKFGQLGGVEGMSAYSTSKSSSANVEACFWIPSEENPMIGKQWRVRGKCVVLPRDLEDSSESAKETKTWLSEKLRTKKDEEESEPFDFVREQKAHFGNLSPALRGSFRNPPPGAPKELGDQGLKPSRKINDDELEEEVAMDNFRLAVIEPIRVEFLDLEVPSKTVWISVGSDAEKLEGFEKFGKILDGWREVQTWP